ncbi:MAG: penicillin-binding protein 2 [Alteromonas naphthalenivorans]|jgi:penicillin-binding protein 2
MIPAQRTFNSKNMFLLKVCTAALCIIAGRLFYLQINQGKRLFEQSQKNFTRTESLLSLRGNILDCHGHILATNKPITAVYWQGTGNKKLSSEQLTILKQLEHLTDKDFSEKEQTLTHTEKHFKKQLLVTNVSFEQLSKIAELLSDEKNITIETKFKRFYPYKSIASHALGYLGHLGPSYEGRMGLEKLFEEQLRGKKGSLMRVINSVGTHLSEYQTEETLSGNDIKTTLDLSLQRIAERIFPKDRTGTLILMDPRDGSLRVILSRPTFDPNVFMNPLNPDQWQELQAQKPFLNRFCNASYPPGSIFKLVTLSAAIETNIIDPYSTWDCKGFVTLANRKYRCARRAGHGELTTKQAVANSCNILFYEIAKKMDIDVLAKYAQIFGFGKPTSHLLSERTGLVPTREWKQETKGERWWLGETLSASIGQSFLLTTPLQIARMIGSIETGYLVSTRLIENSTPNYEPLKIKYETRAFLRQTMHAVVTKGTARMFNKLDDFIIRAKTSTAQTSTLSKRKQGEAFLEHGWFAGNFSFRGSPPLTLVILTENTGNAKLPMLIGREFLKNYQELMELREKKKRRTEEQRV